MSANSDTPGPHVSQVWRRADFVVCVLLVAAVAAVYGQTLGHEFVAFDDADHNANNPYLADGLTWKGIQWAFTSLNLHTWHPLTWASHMLDCELFGNEPWGHHLTNLALHALNSVLLFVVFRRLTGRRWPSAFTAAIFALHPLHAETVAWVSERLDLLCALFWILGLWAYGSYARRPSLGRYLVVALMYVLSLMSKQMVVTFPFVLLLLDVWPFGRWGAADGIAPEGDSRKRPAKLSDEWAAASDFTRASPTRLIGEKIPLFFLSGLGAALALVVKSRFGATQGFDQIPAADRLANAVVSYVAYLVQAVWPARLAVFYPHPGGTLPRWQVAGAAVALVATTAALWAVRRRQPALWVGWLWYLGTLVPVIGLIQVGLQARADRYTYIPLIGIAILVTWGGDALARRGAVWRRAVALLGAAAVVSMAVLCWRQAGVWQSSEILFRHAIEATQDNYWAYNNLGNVFSRRQEYARAVESYRQAWQGRLGDEMIRHNYVEALNHLGAALAIAGNVRDAANHFREAIRVDPGEPKALFNLANALVEQDKVDESIEYFRMAAGAADERRQLQFARQIRVRLSELQQRAGEAGERR